MAENGAVLYKPLGLLAELTHRCPLGCPYCSNPLALDPRGSEWTQTWARVFAEAALGVLQVHLSGGEPGARRDLSLLFAAPRLSVRMFGSGWQETRKRIRIAPPCNHAAAQARR